LIFDPNTEVLGGLSLSIALAREFGIDIDIGPDKEGDTAIRGLVAESLVPPKVLMATSDIQLVVERLFSSSVCNPSSLSI
jgi:hypothetical protein